MPSKSQFNVVAGISADAVRARTGKTWAEWIALLDRAGARKMTHPQIVACLHDQHGVGPWWQQMVTVGYEQARGLRQKHETPRGYQVSVSKTVGVSVARLYRAWNDKRARARWLPEAPLTIRKATPNKSLRITWIDGKTNVEVNFYARGASKCQVTVQHDKLPSPKAGERMKAFWAKRLTALSKSLDV
jgi:uncharacterized protein YndB with AHSA1/START domain